MKANIAYKFELMPTREQTRIFAQAHRVPAFWEALQNPHL